MADKYPSLSPYTYCANNSVKIVDPNGEDLVKVTVPGKNNKTQKITELSTLNLQNSEKK